MDFLRRQRAARRPAQARQDEPELRRHCGELVRGLDLPDPFTVNALVDQMEEHRGRPISLVPAPLPADRGPCGLWIATPEVDYIVYQADTGKAHQGHIVLHEIGHMICEHTSTPAEEAEVSRLLLPHLDPATVRAVLGRTAYDRDEERAAELVASLIPLQAGAGTAPRPEPARASRSPHTAALVRHLERSLERGVRPPSDV
ncbi:hypothetical protein AB0C59_07285 [Streptomyces sp. NPDC048664]|uniref:hypothetical protein n=1 Tax=Streptomyces sp. NPDC048664 TaxID=3154505 RepID=UPI003430C1BC